MREKYELNLLGNFISSLSLALYTSKKQIVTMIKLCKLIPDRFECRKNTYCRFGSLVNGIFVGEIKDNQLSVFRSFLSSLYLIPYLSIKQN